MIFGKIIPRLLLGFLLLSPLPLAGLAWLYIQAFEHSLQQQELTNLSSIADKKADQISAYIDERLSDSRLLAKSQTTLDALQTLPALLAREGIDSPRFRAGEQRYRDYFRTQFDNLGYYDLLLTDAAGNVVLSILHEADFGSNLDSGPYRDTTLARAHREAVALLDTQITTAQPYAPSANKPAIFFVTPILKEGKVLGTLAIQLDLDKLSAVASDATGLGQSGETVLAQREDGEALYVGPLRRIPDAAFRYRVAFDKLALPMRAALAGEHAQGSVRDYAGVETVAAWRHLPALHWGMVVKMDVTEAYAPAYRLRDFSLIALGLLLLAAGLTALLFGRALVAPIRQLTHATRRIAQGDLDQRAPVEGCSEFRQLAESFNQMAERILEEQALLEQRVALRTADMQEANQQLHEEVRQRQQIETALIEAKQSAEAASRAKSEFLANMSHEIRTPMNAILGLTQLVLDSELSASQRDFLHKAHTSARALLGILNDILDYSKIESGRLEIERMPFHIEEVLEQVADLFGAHVEEKELELFFEIAPEVPATVIGDPLRLTQVLNNLVGNAVKFTARGEIVVKVELVSSNPASQRLRFSVRDTGIGMTREQADRLFQPFTQADNSITRKFGGTGLGLSICQRLVELMGGEISVSGAAGQGSTFAFSILVGTDEMSDAAPGSRRIRGMRALVVDDLETSRHILEQLLQGWGLETSNAASGEDALAQIEAAQRAGKPFDALLLDWRMPGMDGLEVARRIESSVAQGRLTHPLLVIMVTAHDKEQLLAEAGATSLDAVLTKPLTPSHLHDTLTRLHHPAAAALAEAHPATPAPCLQGIRILLVEDNALNRQVAAEFLKRRGATLTFAKHGGEAVKRASAKTFDAVLMDLHMPVMDGFEATRRIRELPGGRELPIIAMTAAVLQEDRDRCSAAGMVDFIAKPVDPQIMTEVLLKWVKPHRPAAPAALDNRPGPRPAAVARSSERQALAELLQHLSPFLHDHELVPLELLEELNRHAASGLPGTPLARLIRQIDHFDYDGALASVTQLLPPLIM